MQTRVKLTDNKCTSQNSSLDSQHKAHLISLQLRLLLPLPLLLLLLSSSSLLLLPLFPSAASADFFMLEGPPAAAAACATCGVGVEELGSAPPARVHEQEPDLEM